MKETCSLVYFLLQQTVALLNQETLLQYIGKFSIRNYFFDKRLDADTAKNITNGTYL